MECRSIGGYVQSTDITAVVWCGGDGLPRDLGLCRFLCPGAVQFGVVVAGAPLPTEIRLISQELPNKRKTCIFCAVGTLGSNMHGSART